MKVVLKSGPLESKEISMPKEKDNTNKYMAAKSTQLKVLPNTRVEIYIYRRLYKMKQTRVTGVQQDF